MTQPGWYPDPADNAALRYWSGTEWTTQVQPGPPTPPRRGPLWLIIAATGVAILVVALVVWWLGRPGRPDAEATAHPTRSVWDDSGATSPTPSTSASVATACSDRITSTGIPQTTQAGRLTVGHLSMPVPSGWSGPVADSRLPYGHDGWGYRQLIAEETKIAWGSSVLIGFTAFGGNPSVTQMSQTIADCVSASTFYSGVKVRVVRSTTTSVRISGFDGAQTDLQLAVDDPRLTTTKGSMLRVIVTRTSGQSQYFFSAVPVERSDHREIVDQTTKGLRAS
jgi:hypothetical protein